MAKRASENIRYYSNPNGPLISTVSCKVIERDGLYFKDLDNSGEFQPYDDWRLPPEERAAAYVKVLTVDEKIAQLFISDWRMGKYPAAGPMSPEAGTVQLDESETLDETEFHGKSIFGEQHLPGTTDLIKKWFARHLILRANLSPYDLADWINQLHATAEECDHFVPVQVVSNSRNENGEVVFGMNDAAGVFAAWPGTLGIAAAVMGSSIDVVDRFADCIRREWDAVGMKKGYMYMADVITDPRWQRSYGTFGEDPALVSEIFGHLIPGIQGGENGVTQMTWQWRSSIFPAAAPVKTGLILTTQKGSGMFTPRREVCKNIISHPSGPQANGLQRLHKFGYRCCSQYVLGCGNVGQTGAHRVRHRLFRCGSNQRYV